MDERKYTVYMHTNKINNKAYIGITCQPVETRWDYGFGYKQQPVFYGAIKKYGWDNFEHIIFTENLSVKEARHIERLLIELYQTNCQKYHNPSYGYNMTDGGESNPMFGKNHTEETREKLSAIQRECWKDEQYRQNQIESHKWQTGENHPFWGKHHSQETKDKIALRHTKFAVFCVELGMTFQSSEDAKRKIGVDASDIRKCCKGLINHAGRHPETGQRLHWVFLDKEVLAC
jgi:group I intron endonuclease